MGSNEPMLLQTLAHWIHGSLSDTATVMGFDGVLAPAINLAVACPFATAANGIAGCGNDGVLNIARTAPCQHQKK